MRYQDLVQHVQAGAGAKTPMLMKKLDREGAGRVARESHRTAVQSSS
jgi:hypothetical protein